MTEQFAKFTQETSDLLLAGLQKTTDAEIIAALEPMLRGKQLLGIDTQLVGKPGITRTFKRRASVNASTFAEGADIYQISPDIVYDTVDCTPSNFGASDAITGDALDAEDFDVINDTKQAIVDAMARFIDSRIWNRILNVTTETDDSIGPGDGATKWFTFSPAGGFTSGSDAILDMINVKVDGVAKTEGTDYSVDYYNGKVYLEAAPGNGLSVTASYYWAKTRHTINAKTVNQLSYEDLVDASGTVSGYKGEADAVVTHTNEKSDLLKEQKFIDASQYGSTEPIWKGEIGSITGLALLPTTEMYEGVGVVLQSGPRMGRYVYKKKMTTKVEKLQKKADDVFMGTWEKSDICVVNTDLICLIVNAQRYAKKYT